MTPRSTCEIASHPLGRHLRDVALAASALAGSALAQGASMVDLDPAQPPTATWPLFVDEADDVGSPGTTFAESGTGRGVAIIDLVGPDPSDPSALDKVGPPDGIPDLLQTNSNSPGLPLSAGSGSWVQAPVGTQHSGSLLLRTETNGKRTDVTALVSPFDTDGFSMEFPGGSPWGAIGADYDGDGDQDVFFPCGGFNLNGPNNLMRNEGDGTFRNVSQAAGFTEHQATFAACWFDYDRDGDLDLHEVNAGTAWGGFQGDLNADPDDRLFQNQGDGTFVDVAPQAQVDLRSNGFSVVSSDLDRDGWPDLAIACFRQLNKTFYNDGDGTFSFMAPQQNTSINLTLAGSMVADPGFPGTEEIAFIPPQFSALLPLRALRSMPVVIEDFNGDGWPDIFFASWSRQLPDADPNGALGAFFSPWDESAMYLNRGDGDGDGLGDGLYREVAAEVGIDHVGGCMGLFAGDFNGDGYMDLYLGGGGPEIPENLEQDYLYIAEGPAWPQGFQADPDMPLTQVFYEVGALAGTYANLDMSHGVIGATGSSGRLDVPIGNGGPAVIDAGQPNTYWSHSGNESGAEPAYLQVDLVPKGTHDIGAQIELMRVDGDGASLRSARERFAGQAFASQDDSPRRFGLGDGKPALVTARWPSGARGGHVFWPQPVTETQVTLVEPDLSFALDIAHPPTGGVELRVHMHNRTRELISRILVYGILVAAPGGDLVPVWVVPLTTPLPLPPDVPLDLVSGVVPSMVPGLHVLIALDPLTGEIMEVGGDWHDPADIAVPPPSPPATDEASDGDDPRHAWVDGQRASPKRPSAPVGAVVIGRRLKLEATELQISPARVPFEWQSVDLTGTGSLRLRSGEKLRWNAGQATFDVPSAAGTTVAFTGQTLELSSGGAQDCCELQEPSAGTLLRFGGSLSSIVVDDVHYSPAGERTSP